MNHLNHWRDVVRVLLLAVTFFGFVVTAQAHTGLKESTPGDGAVVKTAPEQINLQFTEAVSLMKFVLHGQDGNQVDLGFQPQTSPRTEYLLPVSLMAGAYHVEWAVVGADGHTVSGEFGFTVDPSGEMEHAGQHADSADHHAH